MNPKTIRFYEQIGLLPVPCRAGNGYRLYREADRDRLLFIQKAKGIGLSLSEIGEVLALGEEGVRPCAHVQALLNEKIAAINRQMEGLADIRQELVRLRDIARDHPAGLVCGIIEGSDRAAGRQERQSPPRAGERAAARIAPHAPDEAHNLRP